MSTLTINTPAPLTLTPGVETAIPGISLSEDPSSPGETLVVQVDESNGGTLGTTGNEGTITFPVQGSTSSIAFVGTIDQINADLAGLTDTALPGAPNNSITLNIGAEGSTGEAPASGQVDINEVAPTLSVNAPSTTTLAIGQPTAISGLSVSETPAVLGETLVVQVDEGNGGTLATTGNEGTISFPVQGSTSSIAFVGTIDQINADLAGLTDTAAPGAPNNTVNMSIGVAGSLGETPVSSQVSFTETPPTLTVNAPSAINLPVGQATAIPGLSLSETPGIAGETLFVRVDETNGGTLATTASQGTIAFPVGGSESSITFTGTIDQVNADLAGLTDSALPGNANLDIGALGSLGETVATADVAITGTPPTLSVNAPSTSTLIIGATTAIAGLSLSETPTVPGETLLVRVDESNGGTLATTANQGTVTFPVAGSTSSIEFTGTLDQVNADLAGLTDAVQPGAPGGVVGLTVGAAGSLGETIVSQQFALTEAPPTLTVNAPSSITLPIGVATAISGISLSETPGIAGEPLVVRIDEQNGGSLGTTGNEGTITFPVAGSTSSIAFAGTIDQINADLAGLTDTALPSSTTSATGLAIAAVGSFGDSALGEVAIAAPPTLTVNAPASVTVPVGVATAISGISVSETPGISGEPIVVRVDEGNGGVLATTANEGTILFPVQGSQSSIVFAGSLDQVNADLAGLTDTAAASAQPVALTIGVLGSFGEGANGQTDITPACYVRGARIATPGGETAIEKLAIGDCVVTASGFERPIRWMGWRSLDCSRHPEPESVWPVRVRAHAFGEGLPRRDLWLSPEHCIAWNGVLMPISRLINGHSVAQVNRPHVEYWHVELDDHDILLAEGLAAESYLDSGNRAAFANGGAFVEAHPDFRPRHWTETCLPLVTEGPQVAEAKAQLLSVMEQQGYEVDGDADAHVRVDGQRIEPIRLTATRLAFCLPAGGRNIHFCSNTFVPAHTTAHSYDTRVLGLSIMGLQIDGSTVALQQDEICATGWHQAEFDGDYFTHRWTNGMTPLPAGARIVIVDIAQTGSYWRAPEENVVALFI